LVVGCSILVDVSVHGGMLTMAGSWWGEKVITPNNNNKYALVVLSNRESSEFWILKHSWLRLVFETLWLSVKFTLH